MNDEEYMGILSYGKPTGTIKLESHPKDVIDVDPVIIRQMKSSLSGNDHLDLYDRSDRAIDELAIQREKAKLSSVFSSESEILEAFSSVKSIRSILNEIDYQKVDKNLLAKYALIKSKGSNVDQVDLYLYLLFGSDIVSKETRVGKLTDPNFKVVLTNYKTINFEVLSITKECISMDETLRDRFNKRTLGAVFDEFLAAFYGGSNARRS